jgi:acyl-CoA reductase-like NAD-dependent aldehyde dehydrogenase
MVGMPEIADSYSMLIDGELVGSSSKKTFEVTSPGTLETLTRVPDGTAADADRAVAAAARAKAKWAGMSMSQRGELFRALSRKIAERAEDIARIEALDSGATVSAMRRDLMGAQMIIQWYTGVAPEMKGDTMPDSSDGLRMVIHEPLGVAVSYAASNHPFLFSIERSIGALLAGNTMVLRAHEVDPITTLLLGELIAETFPAGVWNIVCGQGPAVGATLAAHRDVRRIIFTGSVAVGKEIFKSAAASGLKSVTLELGGKNPFVVFPDADIPAAVQSAVAGMNLTATAGQSCASMSRVFLHRDIHDEFLDLYLDTIAKISMGLPLDEEAQMGAQVSEAQYDKVLRYVGIGQEEGAKLVVGGGRPDDPALVGHYVVPTVFDEVRPDMRIAQEEIFGPVVSVMPWDDEADVTRAMNDVDYGLSAAIWTNDLSRALRMVRAVEAGIVSVNGRTQAAGMPFGGYKDSGMGRLSCLADLYANTQAKSVNINIG